MEVLISDVIQFLWGLVYDHSIEETKENYYIGLRVFYLIGLTKTRGGGKIRIHLLYLFINVNEAIDWVLV